MGAPLPVKGAGGADRAADNGFQMLEMNQRPIGCLLFQGGKAGQPFQIGIVTIVGRQVMGGCQAIGQIPVALAHRQPGVIDPHLCPERGRAQRFRAGRGLQHQIPRAVMQLGVDAPQEPVQRQAGIGTQRFGQRQDQIVDTRPSGLKRDTGLDQRPIRGRQQGQQRFGLRPFLAVQHPGRPPQMQRCQLVAVKGQEGLGIGGIQRRLGPEPGALGTGLVRVERGQECGLGLQRLGLSIAEPVADLIGGQVRAQRLVAAPLQQRHAGPVGMGALKCQIVLKAADPGAQRLPVDQRPRQRPRARGGLPRGGPVACLGSR